MDGLCGDGGAHYGGMVAHYGGTMGNCGGMVLCRGGELLSSCARSMSVFACKPCRQAQGARAPLG